MRSPGEDLLELCAQATNAVVLVAPFIKSAALERVLDAIPTGITAIRCITRWRPEEIAAGASDVEIFDLLQLRPGARLFIHPLLHAKFFRADGRCLIGSSNLTQRALGWATPANFELVLETPFDTHGLRDFERLLFTTSFEASEQLKKEMIAAAEVMRASGNHPKLLSEEGLGNDNSTAFPANGWLPLCTRPDRLYQIYASQDIDRIVGWTLEAGQRDIRSLRIPDGFSGTTFCQFVAASIQQTPLVQRIHEAAGNAIAPEAGRNLIASSVDEQYRVYSPEEHWNTVKAWLLHFLPRIYRQPSGSNDLQRGAQIGEFSG
jgi:hypothetical protein